MLLLLPQAMTPRVDLGELKSHLAKRLGPERARRYFSYLHRLLSQKLSKAEFNKLCFVTLGRENLPLHNLLIQSVIKNAFQAKSPPPLGKPSQNKDGLKSAPSSVWSSWDILAPSQEKRWARTQRSKFGLSEREDVASKENGDLVLNKRQEGQDGELAEQSVKRRRVNRNDINEVVFIHDGECMEQENNMNARREPLQAPFGIPFCPPSVGASKRFSSFWGIRELCHTEDLRRRMETMAESHGLENVTLDCANLLNSGLDAYLKRLIKSSLELAKARMGRETTKYLAENQMAHGKTANGIFLGNADHVRCSSGPVYLQEGRSCLISLLDLTLAMKMNRWQLGEVASLLLEKMCFHSFEEWQ